MAGESDLGRLLAGMEPALFSDPYGFALSGVVPTGLAPFAVIAEDEGISLVALSADLAQAGLDPGAPFARITLTIHSDLAAVGLTAAFATALAGQGISANVIAGVHHDHIFVGWDRRGEAMAALRALSAKARAEGNRIGGARE